MKLVIANARISSDGFTEFAVYLSEYGIEVRFNADGELEYKHPLQTVWSTEANIGREYYKNVIGKPQNGLNSGASERGAVGRTAPTDDEKGAGQRRADDASQSEQTVIAQVKQIVVNDLEELLAIKDFEKTAFFRSCFFAEPSIAQARSWLFSLLFIIFLFFFFVQLF